MEEDAEKYLFEKMPVPKAVATLAIPTIISQVVTMIYNLADTFFVGQIGDPLMVAAVSLVSPWFNPVSYTHLHIYSSLSRGSCFWKTQHHPQDCVQAIPQRSASERVQSLRYRPVSYTHLRHTACFPYYGVAFFCMSSYPVSII